MKHRSSSPSRDVLSARRTAAPLRTGLRASTRLLVGGLLAAATSSVLLAVPVFSGAGELLAPVAGGTPALSAASEAQRASSPVVMGVDGSSGAAPAGVPAKGAGSVSPSVPAPAAGRGVEGRSGIATQRAGGTAAGETGQTGAAAGKAKAAPAPAVPGKAAPAPAVPGKAAPAPAVPGKAAPAPAVPGKAAPAACAGGGRSVVRPHAAGSVLSSQWKASAPAADVTYDLNGVVSTAFPSTQHPFNTGTGTPGVRTCVVGGELRGTVDPRKSWEWFHDEANAACVKVVALEWLQISGTRCHGVEDGFRPQEGTPNSNRTTFRISGTYVTNVADDCLENDYILGGVLEDNLWESCFTGISERPSADRTWKPPANETLVLDRMLIGLRSMPHDSDKGVGPNALFKWSTSANKVVIKCSTFFVPQKSVNNTDTMAIPAGTVVDDSACPNNPSTIVWTGGGAYPAPTAGIRVVTDRGVWDRAVANWKTAHGVS